MEPITGLILAGGAGRRIGGQDKGMLKWRGQPLAAHVAARLRPQVDKLIISCNRNQAYYATLADDIVSDTRPYYQGPLAGLESARNHIETDLLLIAPCDAPMLPLDLCRRLQIAVRNMPNRICYAHDGNRPQYLCAMMWAALLEQLPDYLDAGHRAVHQWYSGQDTHVVDFSDQAAAFINCNSRLDLEDA